MGNCCDVLDEICLPNRGHRTPSPVFIFVGKRRSGKSTAIKRIFDIEILEDAPGQHEMDKTVAEVISQTGSAIIAEAEGLWECDRTAENASILWTVSKYITEKVILHKAIGIFITAPLNDNRFDGPSSEFIKALYAIKLLLDNFQLSGVVLVLTHGDRPDIQTTKETRIQKYIQQYRKVFGFNFKAIYLVVGDKSLTTSEAERQFGINQSLQQNLVKQLLNAIEQNQSTYRWVRSLFAVKYDASSEASEREQMQRDLRNCLETPSVGA